MQNILIGDALFTKTQQRVLGLLYGTPDKSAVIELANGAASILFKPSSDGGEAVIEVRSQSFKGSYIRL